MKTVVIHLKLFWFKLQIETQGKYHLPFFELCEFELKEFFCKGLLVNSVGSEEFIRFG